MAQHALHIDGGRVEMPASAFDHAGFRAWVKSADFPEHVRVSYIRGQVYLEMSPEAVDSHNKVKLEVTAVLAGIIDGEDLGEAYADGVLLTHELAELSTEPDLTFASWATLAAGRLRLVPKMNRPEDPIELDGSPDLVVEVVSDSSVGKDRSKLRDAYHRATIPEYWIIDARGDAIEFTILVHAPTGYRPAAGPDQPQASGVLGRTFALERERNRAGRWRYRLRVV